MKILYIIPYVPYPLNSGGNQAFFNMVDAIRKVHKVSICLYLHSEKQEQAAYKLQTLWEDVDFHFYVDHSRQPSVEGMKPPTAAMSWTNRLQCKVFEYIQHSMERKIARRKARYSPKKVQQSFNLGRFVRENSVLFKSDSDLNEGFLNFVYKTSRKGFDLIQVEFADYLPLVYLFPQDVKTSFVHHELGYIRKMNEMQLFDQITHLDGIRFEWQKAQEMAMLSAYDHVIVLTDTDKELLEKEVNGVSIYVSPAITNARPRETCRTFSPAHEIVLVGSGDHFPNADGILWFCQEVAPRIKELRGNIPPIRITGVWNKYLQKIIQTLCPEAQFTGFVESLVDFLQGRISIIPIRIGSGMRMKILDAIAANSPIVTTSKGCEGYPLVDKEDYLIADDPDDFAKAVCNLLNETKLQESLASSASNKVRSIHNVEDPIQRRMDFYNSLSA